MRIQLFRKSSVGGCLTAEYLEAPGRQNFGFLFASTCCDCLCFYKTGAEACIHFCYSTLSRRSAYCQQTTPWRQRDCRFVYSHIPPAGPPGSFERSEEGPNRLHEWYNGIWYKVYMSIAYGIWNMSRVLGIPGHLDCEILHAYLEKSLTQGAHCRGLKN